MVEQVDQVQSGEVPNRDPRGRMLKGFSANPKGRPTENRRAMARYRELASGFVDLTAIDSSLLLAIARLQIKSETTRDAAVMLKTAGMAFKMLASLRPKARKGTASAPLRDRLSEGVTGSADIQHGQESPACAGQAQTPSALERLRAGGDVMAIKDGKVTLRTHPMEACRPVTEEEEGR
jgi:hypothetical protein